MRLKKKKKNETSMCIFYVNFEIIFDDFCYFDNYTCKIAFFSVD